jgi:bifunctional ADP-heptose synthase (sugar kinase/adenylyltransferase)
LGIAQKSICEPIPKSYKAKQMSSLKHKVQHFIDEVSKMRVCVIGETIVDEFIEVKYEGQSMKSFCPVFSYANPDGETQVQMGGAAAIANHLEDIVASVKLISNSDREIVKTRLIDKNDHKKHVEINKFDDRKFGEVAINPEDYDVVIVADFGHGFCDKLKVNGKFHFMTQTNSNNFGYNRMSKWKSYPKKSACMDLREASLQLNRKTGFNSRDSIRELYGYELGADKLFLTLGKDGSVFFDGQDYLQQKAFKGDVVDTIGAGDTFFAFAALASEVKFADVNDTLIVPSLAASLSCTWLCNEQAVTKEKLLAYADRFIQ